MQYPFWTRALLLGLVTTLVGGCASWMPETAADVDKEARYNQIMEALQKSRSNQGDSRKFFASTPWIVGGMAYEHKVYPELERIPLTLAEYNKTLPEIIRRLQKQTSVRFRLNNDLFVKPEESDNLIGEGEGMLTGTDSAGSTMDLLGANALGAQKKGNIFDDPTQIEVNFEVDGSLVDALDVIVSQLGISWKYDIKKNQVTFFRLDQKNFQIFFPGVATAEIGIGGSGGNEETKDKVISQEASLYFDSGTWEEVASGVKEILSPWGNATIVKSTGNIIVKDTPEAIAGVEEYVRNINAIYGRQVYLEIKTASVKMQNSNNFNVAWRGILNAVNGDSIELGLNSASMPTTGMPNALNVIRSRNGAALALELLATKSASTETNEQSVTTLSNQPASLKVLTETGFIKGVSMQGEAAEVENVISEVETDTVQTGFDATLIPRVVNKNSLQLQVAMELSGNLTLQGFDNTLVQTPTQDRNTVVQRAWLNSGETWVIAAFKSDQSSEEEQGSGTSSFWGLGGGTSKSKQEQVLLVMITPHIMDGAYSE